jgi:hypothetical protein
MLGKLLEFDSMPEIKIFFFYFFKEEINLKKF